MFPIDPPVACDSQLTAAFVNHSSVIYRNLQVSKLRQKA